VFLPRFDAQGMHAATPAELQVAARADELLDRQFLADKARDIIARLPDLYREAFVLRDLEEMSTADVARALAWSPRPCDSAFSAPATRAASRLA
jgi:DNA-directed RNA polymerase specialized sigma24 family protein